MKVFCSDCKYYGILLPPPFVITEEIPKDIRRCKHNPKIIITPTFRKECFEECNLKNKNNDCQFFIKKSSECSQIWLIVVVLTLFCFAFFALMLALTGKL